MFEGINAITFSKRFTNNKEWYNYLIAIKWSKGFQCSKCNCEESYRGRTYYYRRCKQCGYDESVTDNTLFHGMKVQAAMKKDKNDKLNGKVDIDETLIGGYPSAVGRSIETKSALLVEVEILPDGRTGNIQMQPIENFKADTLKFAIKNCV